MYKKIFPWENCPECGDEMEVETRCSPEHDIEDEVSFTDGDVAKCLGCGYTTCVSACSGEIWLQD